MRIRAVSYYHLGTVLYALDELAGYWLEEALVDPVLNDDFYLDQGLGAPASDVYLARTEVKEGAGLVTIEDMAGQRVCCLWKVDAPGEVAAINQVAGLRAEVAFEGRYQFDGRRA